MYIFNFILTLVFKLPVRLLVFLLPRDKKIIVYGGAMDMFVDNNKYQFINDTINLPNYRRIWLSRNNEVIKHIKSIGLEAYRSNSIKGIWLILRAHVVIFDDAVSRFSYEILASGSLLINLWHGIPAKSITDKVIITEKDIVKHHSIWDRIRNSTIRGDYTICTHKKLQDIFSVFARLPKSNLIMCGYPRTSILFYDNKMREEFINKYETMSMKETFSKIRQSKNTKIIYMPTFRDNNPNYLNEAIPNWDALNNQCSLNDIDFIIKVHRITAIPQGKNYSNIIFLDNSLDIYPLLPEFDLLITDYSSIMFDYSLLKKPIIIYDYDLDQYIKESRNVYPHFLMLLKRLTCVRSFDMLLHKIPGPYCDIKKLPWEEYFENPQDFYSVSNLIISMDSNKLII